MMTLSIQYQRLLDCDRRHKTLQASRPFAGFETRCGYLFRPSAGGSSYRLAKEIGVSQARIAEIIAGKRAITVDTGLRLSRYFGLNDAFWTGLQMDCETATQKVRMAETLTKIKPLEQKAA